GEKSRCLKIWDGARRPPSLPAHPGHPGHRQYLRNQAWEAATALRDTPGGDSRTTEAAYRRLLDLQHALIEASPADAGKKHELGVITFELGTVLDGAGQTEGAKEVYREAASILQKLEPARPAVRQDLVNCLRNLRDLLRQEGAWREVIEACREVVKR